ncbi:PC-esterase domain-containing protein 1A-like isoform X2 [Centruroides sculpturatus]|uniref:PC-esterase domain-containing protein 1A-like isoform X2 n=1 Tax=Centruroides sculpturatus TaxID=218467 RepID=UPI000C6EC97C|nr:PC-esterase domain-containing protein 1A-like isoform X2 [Centruroides sculpturatus]
MCQFRQVMAVIMPDIFLHTDLKRLLSYKMVVFLGDSNTRAIYKDFVALAEENNFVSEIGLKTKMERSFLGDELVFSIRKTNERIYKEERVYKKDCFCFEFYFITKVYDEYMEYILDNLTKKMPDIVLINSCLWDITRWGPRGVEKYKENLKVVAKKFRTVLPEDTLVVWLTTLPISQDMRGGVLVPQLEFLKYSLRYHVMEANRYARNVFVQQELDVLDLHYHLQMHIYLRGPDGIHWLSPAVRHMSNLILTHVSLAWGVSLPSRFKRFHNLECVENAATEEWEKEKKKKK